MGFVSNDAQIFQFGPNKSKKPPSPEKLLRYMETSIQGWIENLAVAIVMAFAKYTQLFANQVNIVIEQF